MALSEIDRQLLARCLDKQPKSWEDFVDRYMGLVVHVINHSAQSRSMRLTNEDREDLASEVFVNIVHNDFSLLRHFRGESSLATYLTVITRRIVVAQLLKKKSTTTLNDYNTANATHADGSPLTSGTSGNGHHDHQLHNRDEVEQLLSALEDAEAQIVKLFHLEGKSYQEISKLTGMDENSIGPTLSRARDKLRKASAKS